MRSSLIGAELTLAFPPAFTITSPSPDGGEVMVKVGGKTLLSNRSRVRSLIWYPQFLRKTQIIKVFGP
jgi:hypothetical protein